MRTEELQILTSNVWTKPFVFLLSGYVCFLNISIARNASKSDGNVQIVLEK